MKKLMVMLFALLPSLVMAAGDYRCRWTKRRTMILSDKASLAARCQDLYMNYCFGCHATQYQRYERVANGPRYTGCHLDDAKI